MPIRKSFFSSKTGQSKYEILYTQPIFSDWDKTSLFRIGTSYKEEGFFNWMQFNIKRKKLQIKHFMIKNPQTSWGWKRSKITAFLTRLKFDLFFSVLLTRPQAFMNLILVKFQKQINSLQSLFQNSNYFSYHTLI